MKIPISLIIDDSAPIVHIYRSHVTPPKTRDGREILKSVPNSLLTEFCDQVERFGIKGKFSVVPCPACFGCITDTIDGFPRETLTEWLDTVSKRLSPYFDFCPEIITHSNAVDMKNGGFLDITEREWASNATETEMTDYIARSLELCRDAGIVCTGVTSPWDFAVDNEANYTRGIADAFDRVFNKSISWYFLHGITERDGIRAWVEYDNDGKKVVSVPKTVSDYFWGTIDTPCASDDFISHTADYFITDDGKSGAVIDALDRNCFPVICTHWQSMFSNGSFAGVKALAVVGERIEKHLSDRVEWVDFSTQTELAIKDDIKRPIF